ncbi:ROK family protein [Paenarthrobacter sp. PH39-S1]|uniref:ROK family protein n=1 Tax=Paenarthrobacter sp. PH39-S1 TaxID=3046204 RepID=UPI0024B8DD8A|nr:ROK family protein [Paenarthrobacter sp. PH39-S1]MDJ0358198.1 ROK family protein [Paenarthrobacter sp. PH39-S1]
MKNGSRTRRELEADTKLSRTTLSVIVGNLRQYGILTEADQSSYGPGRNGRPVKVLRLNPVAGVAVGVELARSRISVSVVGFDGSPVAREHIELSAPMDLAAKVEHAAGMLRTLVGAGEVRPESLVGMGVGIASRHADPRSLADAGGDLQHDPQGVSLAPLRDAVATPLLWDNNIRLAAMAAATENGNPNGDLLYVVLSAGISCAVVVDGALLRGGNGIAGELGHISVDFSGPRCWCGHRGCLERFLNVANVLAEAEKRGQAFESIESMAAAAEAGNRTARAVVDWAAELLSRALTSACVLVDPNRVVVAGELAQFGEPLLEPVRKSLAEQQLEIGPRATIITRAPFSPTSGSDGAAIMALRHWAFAGI